jgi:hypothetical protein
MRYAIAIGIVAVTLAAAVYVHERHVTTASRGTTDNPFAPAPSGSAYFGDAVNVRRVHPSWEDPVAVLLILGGLAVSVGVVATGRQS